MILPLLVLLIMTRDGSGKTQPDCLDYVLLDFIPENKAE